MNVAVNIESVRVSESGMSDAIFSRICFEVRPGIHFPDFAWDDFAEVILTWWMGEALNFLDHGGEACFRFMDGDFCVVAKEQEDGFAEFRFFENGRLTDLESSNFSEFAESLLKSSRALSRTVHAVACDRKMDELFLAHQNGLMKVLREVRR